MNNKTKTYSIDEYLKLQNVDIENLKCSCCGCKLVEEDDIKGVLVKATQKHIYFIKDNNVYSESDANRWIIKGKNINGQTYRRNICWNCFFEKVNAYIRESGHLKRLGQFRHGKQWNQDFANGIYRVPSIKASFGSRLNKFLFDISDSELDKQKKKFSTATKDYWIDRLGKNAGAEKYDELVDRQRYTASSKYLIDEKGLSKDEALAFHKNRASTRENFIKRYGEEDGQKYWDEYCMYESYAGCALDYFIDKFGVAEGTKKYKEINKLKYKAVIKSTYSRISQELFDKILENINDSNNVYYATHNNEVLVETESNIYFLDFVYKNKVIEFYGDYWHRNPIIYKEDDEDVKNIHESDNLRIAQLKEIGYNILIVWEHDYNHNPDLVLKKCLEFLND